MPTSLHVAKSNRIHINIWRYNTPQPLEGLKACEAYYTTIYRYLDIV